MEHPKERILHAYVDQMLDRPEAKAVQGHLAQCPQCQRTVDGLALLFQELAALPSPAASPGFSSRIIQAQQQEGWRQLVPLDLFAFLFGRVGWATVTVGLLSGILLAMALDRTWVTTPASPTSYAYETLEDQDLYLGYLISDNGDIL